MNKNPAGLAVLPLLLSLLNSWVCLVPVYTTSASSHEQSKPSAPILLLHSGYWYCSCLKAKIGTLQKPLAFCTLFQSI